jgi:predicted nucleotidyltransferase
MMLIDEALLYKEDHHERCMEYIQRYFREAQPPYVRAVYALGSIVTGDYFPGYSDLDILILTDDVDQNILMRDLRAINDKLLIPTFHLHKSLDFPPPDLYLRIRLLTESRLLFGRDLLAHAGGVSNQELHKQLLSALSHRLVMLRSLCCSKAFDKYAPDYTLYYAQKFCLFGLRALLIMQGELNTRRKHVIAQVNAKNILSPKNYAFFVDLLANFERRDYPQTLDARLAILFGTVEFLEEIQYRIVSLPHTMS